MLGAGFRNVRGLEWPTRARCVATTLATTAIAATSVPALTASPKNAAAQEGSLSIRIGLGWAKSHSFATGQCPVM